MHINISLTLRFVISAHLKKNQHIFFTMYIYNTKINIRISLTLRFVMFVCVGLMDVMCLMMMWHMCVIDDVTHVIDDVTYVSDDDVTHCWSLYAQVWWMWWCGLTSRWRRRRRRSSLRSGFFFFSSIIFSSIALERHENSSMCFL